MHHRSHTLIGAVVCAFLVMALVPVAASATVISRASVLARGKVWLTKHVPYSQTRFAKVDGTLIPTSTPVTTAMTQGYRTDCSGFVSMCLLLRNALGQPMSLSTSTFNRVLTPISANQLQPGDVVLSPFHHVVLFVGWANAQHTSLWTYEEEGTEYGTVSRQFAYPQTGFAPYRYVNIGPWFGDVEDVISGPTRAKTAAAAARITFPTTPTVRPKALVVTNASVWPGNLGGVAVAGGGKGPLLITSKSSLPSTTAATIKRLRPAQVYVIGDSSCVATGVLNAIAKLGTKVSRISGKDRFAVTSNAARTAVVLGRAAGHKSDTAYMVGSDCFVDGAAVAPIAARVARPILLSNASVLPTDTLTAITKSKIKKVIIVGGPNRVGSPVVSALRKHGVSVSRIAGDSASATAFKVAHHGISLSVGFTWNHLGVASATEQSSVLPCAVAQGENGRLLMFTPARSLDTSTAAEIHEQRAKIGHVRVFGDFFQVEHRVRAAIATLMRATK